MKNYLALMMVSAICMAGASPAIAKKKITLDIDAIIADNFAEYDLDGDGYLEEKELRGRNESYMDMDQDGDEKISLEEFEVGIRETSGGILNIAPETPDLKNTKR